MGKMKYILLVLIILAMFLFIAVKTASQSYIYGMLKAMDDAGVHEKEGVLYFPDGQPVRNYEQLGIYLDAELEVK